MKDLLPVPVAPGVYRSPDYMDLTRTKDADGTLHAVSSDGLFCVTVLPHGKNELFFRPFNVMRFAGGGTMLYRMLVGGLNGVFVYAMGQRFWVGRRDWYYSEKSDGSLTDEFSVKLLPGVLCDIERRQGMCETRLGPVAVLWHALDFEGVHILVCPFSLVISGQKLELH